jgi:hypothetical protein
MENIQGKGIGNAQSRKFHVGITPAVLPSFTQHPSLNMTSQIPMHENPIPTPPHDTPSKSQISGSPALRPTAGIDAARHASQIRALLAFTSQRTACKRRDFGPRGRSLRGVSHFECEPRTCRVGIGPTRRKCAWGAAWTLCGRSKGPPGEGGCGTPRCP